MSAAIALDLLVVLQLDLEELHEQFHLAVERLRQKPRMARSFFAQAGLSLRKT